MLTIESENNICLTRGDTGVFTVTLLEEDGADYEPHGRCNQLCKR